jgi:hypothetical protein
MLCKCMYMYVCMSCMYVLCEQVLFYCLTDSETTVPYSCAPSNSSPHKAAGCRYFVL